MDYTVAGFIFHFDLDGNGDVVKLTTPQLGPIGPQSVAYDPAKTVEEVKALVDALIASLQAIGLI